MIKLQGKGVSDGIAFGKISFVKSKEESVTLRYVEDIEGEMKRFNKAKEFTGLQLEELYEKAFVEVGEKNAGIFEMHKLLLDDSAFNEKVERYILSESFNAEYAVFLAANNIVEMFLAMNHNYMRGRAIDIKDVSDRLIKNLMNKTTDNILTEKSIICANDLTPSETVQLDRSKVLAFCTMQGSSNSHTAILARTMNIPAVVSLGDALLGEFEDKEAIVDGSTGIVYIEPDEITIKELEKKYNDELCKRELLQNLKGKENITLDGKKIDIFANIGGIDDLDEVVENDAGGIGLFRSEFLYLESNDYPDEEKQFMCYRKVLERMAGKKVIIRTLDIGADKQIDYFNLDKEENPALGFRAIRICLANPEIFKTQLRALYRASMFGNLGIMFPMIISVEEIEEIKEIIEEVKKELDFEEIPYKKDVEIGIMIETPAAVMISDELAKEVNFFSVGTNDLAQYTLAIDRQNPKLERFCNTHHPAVLKMIRMAADNAHKNGAWIGICGELGGDLELTETFIKMGIDELSVSPRLILPLREKINQTCVLGGFVVK